MIKINGKVIHTGNVTGNMSIVNGEVYIDGAHITGDGIEDSKTVNIEIVGNVGDLAVSGCNYINLHSAQKVSTSSGDVNVDGDVLGDTQTISGDVVIGGSVTGKVKTSSGNVTASKIEGSVRTTSGSIRG
jgi:hypothetical protein